MGNCCYGNAVPGDAFDNGADSFDQHLPRPGATKMMVTKLKDQARFDKGWIAETLKVHNDLRMLHSAPPLQWSIECAEEAQKAADFSTRFDGVQHTHNKDYGQNIFKGKPGYYGAEDAIKSWYDELTHPGYKWTPETDMDGMSGCGHFTQVVWKETTHVGMSCDSSGKGYIVAHYLPAGNVKGFYRQNVLQGG
jgi:uncharacterized protein YkwD